MKKFLLICSLLYLVTNQALWAKDGIYIEAKVALKMIEKSNVQFLEAEDGKILIKGSKVFDIDKMADISSLGEMECSPFYVCPLNVERKFRQLGISKKQPLIIYDHSYNVLSSALYITLESIGYRNMSILNGGLEAIYNVDANQKIYNKCLVELKELQELADDESNATKSQKKNLVKIEELKAKLKIIKPHLLTHKKLNQTEKQEKSDYEIGETKLDYLVTLKELKEAVNRVRLKSKETNLTIVDACPMVDIVGNRYGSYLSGVTPISWKELIDVKSQKILTDERLSTLFEAYGLSKEGSYYLYCMSGSDKAMLMMILLRKLGYAKVKTFTGDWNVWTGGIDEK